MVFDIMNKDNIQKPSGVDSDTPTPKNVESDAINNDNSGGDVQDKKGNLVKKDININNLSKINLFNSTQLAAAEHFLSKIMKSDKVGIKRIEDGLAVLMRAQDLNLPFSACLEHIHVISGKTTIDIHLIKALLSRAGCTWKCLKDYQPQYEYTDGINVYKGNALPEYAVICRNQQEAEDKVKSDMDKDISDNIYVYPVKFYNDVNGNIYKDYQLNSKQFGIAVNRQQIAEITKSGKIAVFRVPAVPIDYVTEYEISRIKNGKEITTIGRFSYSEALAAGFFDKSGDVYGKYARIMIAHRAFTYGARDIASDVLFGVMETTEVKIMNNQPINEDDITEFDDAIVIES